MHYSFSYNWKTLTNTKYLQVQKMFITEVVEKQETHILCPRHFDSKNLTFQDN
jgi:hypothetical protein